MQAPPRDVVLTLLPVQPEPALPASPPHDFVLWSTFNLLLCQQLCCLTWLGFPALVCSIKARDRKMVWDMEGARCYSITALVLNIIGSLVAVTALVVFFIMLKAVIPELVSNFL